MDNTPPENETQQQPQQPQPVQPMQPMQPMYPAPQMQQMPHMQQMQQMQQMPNGQYYHPQDPRQDQGKFKHMVSTEFKEPLVVALLVFLTFLPSVYKNFGTYVPKMLDPTQNLTTFGIIFQALVVAVLFYLVKKMM